MNEKWLHAENMWKRSHSSLDLERLMRTIAETRKLIELSHSQRWPRYVPDIWVPWKISRVPEYAHGYLSKKF